MIQGIVAIVGRPNVGKSTLFNRLTKTMKAIVDDQPGVTRDRIYGTVMSNADDGNGFTVIDTGGFETKDLYYQPFSKNIVWEQTEQAIDSADVVILVFDAKSGLHPHDEQLVQHLNKKQKPVVYVANKMDGKEIESAAWDFFRLGIEDIHETSAAHNRGVYELSDTVEQKLREIGATKDRNALHPHATKIALIGRPNAGKSSILNRIVGESRVLVSDIAGTTRDSIDTALRFNNQDYVLIDTAGIRRRTKVKEKVESLSVMRSLRVIEETDVVVMVVTPEEPITDQDAKLISLALGQFKPVLIVVNKWDLVENKTSNTAKEMEADIHYKLKDNAYVPVMFVSALENLRIHKIMSQVEELAEAFKFRAPTSRLNEVLHAAVAQHTPALIRKYNKRVKFYFATQAKTQPPTIVIKCNVENEIQESYKRYLTHRLRKDLGFGNIPLRVIFRGKEKSTDASKNNDLHA